MSSALVLFVDSHCSFRVVVDVLFSILPRPATRFHVIPWDFWWPPVSLWQLHGNACYCKLMGVGFISAVGWLFGIIRSRGYESIDGLGRGIRIQLMLLWYVSTCTYPWYLCSVDLMAWIYKPLYPFYPIRETAECLCNTVNGAKNLTDLVETPVNASGRG